MVDPNKPSKEKLLYEEVARLNVYPERYGAVALDNIVELPLPELARIYKLLPYHNGQAGAGQ